MKNIKPMNETEFFACVKEEIEKKVSKEETVCINNVLKNNNIELVALCIHHVNNNVSPTIYLNAYYKDYLNGKSLNRIVEEIFQLYSTHKNKLHFSDDMFTDFKNVKDKLVYRLVNKKLNCKLLYTIPSVDFLDLSIIFYFLIDDDYLGTATALVQNVHLDMWTITKDELYRHAVKNTPKLQPACIRDMNEVIKELLAKDIENTVYEKDYRYDINCKMPSPEIVAEGVMHNVLEHEDLMEMYILTNQQKLNGASCILYENILRDFAEKKKTNLFIIPSSIHEVILVPAKTDADKNMLTQMVQEVNSQELDAGEILSSHVYFYNRETDTITY